MSRSHACCEQRSTSEGESLSEIYYASNLRDDFYKFSNRSDINKGKRTIRGNPKLKAFHVKCSNLLYLNPGQQDMNDSEEHLFPKMPAMFKSLQLKSLMSV